MGLATIMITSRLKQPPPFMNVRDCAMDFLSIQLDLIYNGKMLFGLTDLIQQDYFSPGTIILAIHTGGVQGNKGMEERLGLELH